MVRQVGLFSEYATALLALTLIVLILGGNMAAAYASISPMRRFPLLQVYGGKVVKQDGTRVYLDGLNYKDEFKRHLGEDIGGSADWGAIKTNLSDMAALGAKTIRIWFNWIYYEPTPGNLDSTRMLSDMQKVVDIAKKKNLYVIITIYVKIVWNRGTPVDNWLQADATTAITDPDSVDFWLNDGSTPDSQRGRFMDLWGKISSHFKAEGTIAAYDLINEPYNKYFETTPQWTQAIPGRDDHYPLKSLYDQVLQKIRSNGDKHIVILGYGHTYACRVVSLPRHSDDEQVLYDVHFYYTAAENSVQQWDTIERALGDWSGKTPTGEQVTYTYPDGVSAHDKVALRSRFDLLLQAQLNGYTFYIGEFGFTENSWYNADIASLVVEYDFSGFAYFEYMAPPLTQSLGVTAATIQPIMSFVR